MEFKRLEEPILVEQSNVKLPLKDEVPSLDDMLIKAAKVMLDEIIEHDRTMMRNGKP